MKFISIRSSSRRSKPSSSKSLNLSFSSLTYCPEEYSSTGNLSTLSQQSEEVVLMQLKEFCNLFHIQITDVQLFRYALCHDFDYESARRAIELSYDSRYLHLGMHDALVEQFLRRVLIPLPRVKSKDNSKVLYFHASRHLNTHENGQLLLDNLYYLLNDMSQTRQDCRDGVCFVANMKNYGMKNYDMDMILKAYKAVEGKLVPAHFTALIYLDAPKVFINCWKLLRPLLAPWMVKKVHFIKSNKLGEYLQDGYQTHMPEELGGSIPSSEIAEDYVDRKIYYEMNMSIS